MKYLVEFKNSAGGLRPIGQAETIEKCWDIIFKFLEERNYKSYYQRTHISDGILCIDVGKHDEFFYLSKTDKTDMTWEDIHPDEE